MSRLGRTVQPDEHAFLRLPNGILKAIECKPNQIIELGKLGNFPVASLLGRPYYQTYEILDKKDGETYSSLQIVPASELHIEAVSTGNAASQEEEVMTNGEAESLVMSQTKNNRLTVDDGNRQMLSHDEIEELKKTIDGKAIIERILASHTGLDEKTDFSKAKYTMRKARKYLKRFTLLPMEMGYLIEYILEKEPTRIMDFREESLALLTSWSNAHYCPADEVYTSAGNTSYGAGRVLAIDDTGGLVVAALAERKGTLRYQKSVSTPDGNVHRTVDTQGTISHEAYEHKDFPLPATANTITALHSASQANVSILKYFGYDTSSPDTDHPLHTHLKCLSWLQFLHPEEDPLYIEPETVSDDTIRSWKAGKRGAYFKKRRRWQRTKAIGDETRAGSFDSLVIATYMYLPSLLARCIPLLRGGAQVVIYSPTIEPLVQLMDLYSKERRGAFLAHLAEHGSTPESEDFKLDPRLLLAPTLQTSRTREYQVLPGRTHPLMTSRGGSEGYIFTATRVLPAAGGVEARGNLMNKKRRIGNEGISSPSTTS